MCPVDPIPNLPPIVMPTGIRPVGRDRKRNPGRENGDGDERDGDPEPGTPPGPEASHDANPAPDPDDRGQIIDIKA